MADRPSRVGSTPAQSFLGIDSAESAPFPDREFGLAHQLSELLSRVPVLNPLALDQDNQHPLNLFQPFVNRHEITLSTDCYQWSLINTPPTIAGLGRMAVAGCDCDGRWGRLSFGKAGSWVQSLPHYAFASEPPLEADMDILHIALSQYAQLGTRLCVGMTPDLSDDLEAWLRGPVCGVAAHLCSVDRFRRTALWSVKHLTSGATAPERKLVEAVDKALVAKAKVVAEGARALGLIGDAVLPADDSPPLSEAESRPRIEWLADRPWHDLSAADDFFTCNAGLRAVPSRRDCCGTFWSPPDPQVPLGDYVARAMFRRIDLLSDLVREEEKVVEAAASANLRGEAKRSVKDRTQPELEIFARLMQATLDLKSGVDRLKAACYQGEEARLRDACCSLVQVLAAYHPHPNLGWLDVKAKLWEVEGRIVRSYVRSRREQTFCRREVDGTLTPIGSQTASLCRAEISAGVAVALNDVASLFRRPVEPDELIAALCEERRLVLVDLRPRRVYWDGTLIDQDWDSNDKPWELLWAVAKRAQEGKPLNAEDLADMSRAGNPVKHRRGRLKVLLSRGLNNKIKHVRPRGYRLDLKPSELALLQLNDTFGLVEFGIDLLPHGSVGPAI